MVKLYESEQNCHFIFRTDLRPVLVNCAPLGL